MSERECPDCDFSNPDNSVMFTHRVKCHTDAGDGNSFDLYNDEVFDIYVDMAVTQARENARSKYDEVTEEKLVYELGELGVSVGVDESVERFSEEVET